PCSTQNSLSSVQSRDWGLGMGVLPTVSHVWRMFPSQWPVAGTQLWSPHPTTLTTSASTEIRTICATIMSPTERKTRRRSVYTRALSRSSSGLAAMAFRGLDDHGAALSFAERTAGPLPCSALWE